MSCPDVERHRIQAKTGIKTDSRLIWQDKWIVRGGVICTSIKEDGWTRRISSDQLDWTINWTLTLQSQALSERTEIQSESGNEDWYGWTDTQGGVLPGLSRERNLRSKIWWFTEFCNSHYISHFAAFFIVARTKISIAKSCFIFLDV
jgi:hypothetical protein